MDRGERGQRLLSGLSAGAEGPDRITTVAWAGPLVLTRYPVFP